jgi:hypothetical protein
MNAALQPVDDWTGIFPHLPHEEYHRQDLGVASAGGLKLVRRSLAHYHWHHTAPRQDRDTPALRFGRAYHALVLESGTFASQFAVQPKFGDLRTNAAKALRDKWEDENIGKTPIAADDWRVLVEMRDVLMRHPLAAEMIAEGEAESSYRWVDERTGLRCQARPDFRGSVGGRRYFADLKTCEDASPREFARSVVSYDYHVAHCHYADGARQSGEPIDNYFFICQEKSPPYAVAVYTIDAAAEERGFQILFASMDRLAEGVRTNRWPAYPDSIEQLQLPGWAFAD